MFESLSPVEVDAVIKARRQSFFIGQVWASRAGYEYRVMDVNGAQVTLERGPYGGGSELVRGIRKTKNWTLEGDPLFRNTYPVGQDRMLPAEKRTTGPWRPLKDGRIKAGRETIVRCEGRDASVNAAFIASNADAYELINRMRLTLMNEGTYRSDALGELFEDCKEYYTAINRACGWALK